MAKSHSISQAKYDKVHCRTYALKMNLETDSDIIKKLDNVDSKQGYIKQLIREDLARTGSVPKTTESVPKNSDSVPTSPVPVSFRDPYADKIADAVRTWIDNATSVLTDEKPYIISESVPKTE